MAQEISKSHSSSVPSKRTRTPCLELCAAVLSSQAVKKVLKELNLVIHEVVFHTDSNVALAYIPNDASMYTSLIALRLSESEVCPTLPYGDTSTPPLTQQTSHEEKLMLRI